MVLLFLSEVLGEILWGRDVVRDSAAMHSSWVSCKWKTKGPQSSIRCLTPTLQYLLPYTWSCWPGIFLSAALAVCFLESNVSSLRAGRRLEQSSSVQNQKQFEFPPFFPTSSSSLTKWCRCRPCHVKGETREQNLEVTGVDSLDHKLTTVPPQNDVHECQQTSLWSVPFQYIANKVVMS